MIDPSCTLSNSLFSAWVQTLGQVTKEREAEPLESICDGVKRLWQRFTIARSTELQVDYWDDPALRQAYLAYYFPVNAAKVQSLLHEMQKPTACDNRGEKPFRVLDLGCGLGTATHAIRDWASRSNVLQNRPLRFVALDQSIPALQECKRFWQIYSREMPDRKGELETVRADLERFTSAHAMRVVGTCYDLIIMANTLNELFKGTRDCVSARAELVKEVLNILDMAGTLILIEPALRHTSRQLHTIRDLLLAQGVGNVYSPCLHEYGCPALIKQSDWCHEERPWRPPALVQAIDRRVGLIKDGLKFSYLMLRKDGQHIIRRSPDVFRVVSELREMKGEKRAWLCNETGRNEVGRLDREASGQNSTFASWHRGAIVRVEEIVRKSVGDRRSMVGRILRTTVTELLRSISQH
jgi:ribosomal protein RSM22 (predicted rRNA methylase)